MQLIKIIIQNNSRSITLKSAFEQNILYFPDNLYVCFFNTKGFGCRIIIILLY